MHSWIPKTRPSLWDYGMKSEAKESCGIRSSELSVLERALEKEMEAIRKTEAPKPLGVRHRWEEEEEDVELFATYDNDEEGEENSSDGLLSSNTDAVLDESDDMDEGVTDDNDDDEDEELYQQARTGNWWFSGNQ
ncbi:hypothetical protein NDN08_003769 [Rhodosorus marinus]|uniref:Uncharacterized protein n=1 Tax=Rhodosorus marinus TaxID=101924 RepID=A0AAV8UGD4_9RHOD|nr:hypothetical protein NDN08_003769 [Rhodosorus marinus]